MSFILDALRKSEHERQRAASPGLAYVPLATPEAPLPRWAVAVIAALAAAVLLLASAWWQSRRTPLPVAAVGAPAFVERSLELPDAPTSPAFVRSLPASSEPPALARPLSAPAAAAVPAEPLVGAAAFALAEQPASPDESALPSAAALVATGVALPRLRLELHAYAEQPHDRFVFINGRRYVEGERLADGPNLIAIQPVGAVLSQAGQRFLLVPE